jgi:hypothetical protein
MLGGVTMREVVSYEGESGLVAILRALDNVQQLLATSSIEPQQAAGSMGCINLHLAHILGVSGEFLQHLHECGGLLCPECKGYVGSVSNLSGSCHLCGARLFPVVVNRADPAGEGEELRA